MSDKLSELEGMISNEGTKEDGSSIRGKLYVTDESGNVVAVIDEDGVKSLDFLDKDGNKLSQMVSKVEGKGLSTNDLSDELVERIKNSVSNNNIIDDYDGFYICDDNGNVALKIDKQGNVTFNSQTASALNKKNLFTLCDSLGISGIWQNKLAELTGMAFDNTINTDKKFPLSVGGTTTAVSGTGTLQRALYLVEHWAKEKSIDVVIVENINDMTTKIGDKADAPWMLSQQITLDTINANSGAAETYFRSNIATICAGITPKFGTTINVPYYAGDGSKKITISSKASSNGKIIITCAGTPYEVDVITSDSIETIVDKIVEYDFSNGQFSASKLSTTEIIMTTVTGASLSMNVGTTGVGYSITDTKGVATLSFCYKGETLDTWSTLAKWQEQVGDNIISLYSKMKGLFGYLCNKLPNAKIFMGLFPRMTASQSNTYRNDDGTYDIDKFYEDNQRYLNVAKCQAECAEMFGVTVLDMWKESGFSIANSPTMYEGGSGVHPGRVGYERIGETIARLINY